jgi:N-acyl-D-aspartate/D-glutamate deacylase
MNGIAFRSYRELRATIILAEIIRYSKLRDSSAITHSHCKELNMEFDLKITGAAIVNGSGSPAFTGDVGVKNGLIVEIGQVLGAAHRTINADGALLTPGYIDPHTHYDGQAMWDDELVQSSRHGVTTAFLGNCGVGFAPLTPGRQDDLITLMAGVEDIPGSVLSAGLDWKWNTFPDYLDRLAERRWPIDIATQITHDPVRVYVMGERALAREPATDEDIAAMREIVSAGLGAGAFAFSTGRNDSHRMADGRDTPASLASVRELVSISGSLRDHSYRVLQLTSDFDMNLGEQAFDAEFELIEQMADAAGRPVCVNVAQRPGDFDEWRLAMRRAQAAKVKGTEVRVQVAPRGIGVLLGLTSSFHPFIAHPSFRSVVALPFEARVRALRDPALKAKILAEAAAPFAGKGNAAPAFFEHMLQRMDEFSARIFPDRGPRNFEAPYSDSLQAEARRRGVSAVEALYDALLEHDGHALLYWPLLNFGSGNLDYVHEMLTHPQAIMGLGDSGAHVNVINDYSYPTFAVSFWPSKRTAGPGVPLERIVYLMTGAQAAHFNLKDRGLIEVGRRADFNLIDQARLGLKPTRIVRDLPAGGQRMLQDSVGYIATFLGGVAIAENDQLTGDKPGRLLRAH